MELRTVKPIKNVKLFFNIYKIKQEISGNPIG